MIDRWIYITLFGSAFLHIVALFWLAVSLVMSSLPLEPVGWLALSALIAVLVSIVLMVVEQNQEAA